MTLLLSGCQSIVLNSFSDRSDENQKHNDSELWNSC